MLRQPKSERSLPIRTLPPFPTLRAFLDWNSDQGQVAGLPDPVSVRHQMTAVHRAVLERGGPILRFDHPVLENGARAQMPVVVNIFGRVSGRSAHAQPA